MLISLPLERKLGPMTQGRVITDDHTQLSYQVFGQGPAVVLANGIGVRYPAVVEQVTALRRDYQVICWDYRGIGQSVMLDTQGDVSMSRQARDILTILEQLNIKQALFIGWSMGVQVSLEVIRHNAERVAGFVALLGSYGEPFRTALPYPLGPIFEQFFAFMERHPTVAQTALDLAVSFPRLAFSLLSRSLFVGPDADPEVFRVAVRSVAGVEKSLYMRTMLALAQHDATDLLPRISCPTLVICGQRDHLTPPKVARYMADSIPAALYKEITGGTHFALMEQPALINHWLTDFARTVYQESAPGSSSC